jgi:glycosyltransferase involved in cell wall biosynthesis
MKVDSGPLKIAITADPEIPVPPKYYGGIERIIDMLIEGLLARGHQVTLFSHPDSTSNARQVAWKGGQSRGLFDTIRNARTLASELKLHQYDVVHSFSRLAYLTPILATPIPKIMSYQRAISSKTVALAHSLSKGTLSFTAISEWMMSEVKGIGHWDMIPNGVPIEKFNPILEADMTSTLVFLGRLEEIKGPHLAIEMAKRTGMNLILAGNIPEGKAEWVNANVLSKVDGVQIRYIGPVDDIRKIDLLGQCTALVMPILWDEPFGIVMAEALACGTPVLGLNRGAVPEVITNGLTGFVSDDLDGLVGAVGKLASIDRGECRRVAVEKYSADVIVEQYLSTYRSRIANNV